MIKREKFYKQIRIVQFEASKGIIGWEILFYYTFEYLSENEIFRENEILKRAIRMCYIHSHAYVWATCERWTSLMALPSS